MQYLYNIYDMFSLYDKKGSELCYRYKKWRCKVSVKFEIMNYYRGDNGFQKYVMYKRNCKENVFV